MTPVATVVLGAIASVLAQDEEAEIVQPNALLLRVNGMLRTQIGGGRARASAVNMERCAISILSYGFGVDKTDVTRGVRTIRNLSNTTKRKHELSQESGSEIAKAFADHFFEVTGAILSEKNLPFRIRVGKDLYLVTASHAITKGIPRYMPLDESGRPPADAIYGPDCKLKNCSSPRFGTGRPHEEVRKLRNEYSRAQSERMRLSRANTDGSSTTRLRLISEAILSFSFYTYFDTGSNVSSLQGQVRNGEHRNAVTVNDLVDSKGRLRLNADRGSKGYVLHVSKPRAGNKEISILFSSTWVKKALPVYLRLRAHIEALGFDLPSTLIFGLNDPTRSSGKVLSNPRICTRFHNNNGHVVHRVLVKHGIKRLSINQIRNFKSVSLSREHGTAVSAKILGHTQQTALTSYNRISEQEAQLQLSGVINDISRIAILSEDSKATARLDAGGACSKPHDIPAQAVKSSAFGMHSPDCRTKTGCWLCVYFAVHADEEDLWKIKSYLHLIDELQASSDNPIGVRKVHAPIIDRLTDLYGRILDTRPSLKSNADMIDRKIQRGRLHPLYKSLEALYESVSIL